MLVRKENEKLIGKLINWKFAKAEQYLNLESPRVVSIVKTMSSVFHNEGWADGDMGTIVGAVVELLIGEIGN